MALQRRGDAGRHGLRAGAGQLRLHRDGREIDLRQRRDRQLEEREDPGQRDADGQQRGRDRPRDEGGGEVHVGARRRPSRSGARRPDSRTRQPVEHQIDHRRGEQRQHLADDQAADDRDAERPAQLRAGAGAQHQRQRAEQRRHRGHQDRAEAQQAGLMDRLARRLALLALGVEREVDHHDRVLLDDADQQDDADDRDDVEVVAGDQQRQQRADAGRGQRREDRDRVDEALVEHAQHDVDGDDRRQHQQQLVRQRRLERRGRALERGDEALRQVDVLSRPGGSRSPRRRARNPGAVSNEIVVAGNWPRWLICSGPGFCSICTIADSGTCPVVEAADGR